MTTIDGNGKVGLTLDPAILKSKKELGALIRKYRDFPVVNLRWYAQLKHTYDQLKDE